MPDTPLKKPEIMPTLVVVSLFFDLNCIFFLSKPTQRQIITAEIKIRIWFAGNTTNAKVPRGRAKIAPKPIYFRLFQSTSFLTLKNSHRLATTSRHKITGVIWDGGKICERLMAVIIAKPNPE